MTDEFTRIRRLLRLLVRLVTAFSILVGVTGMGAGEAFAQESSEFDGVEAEELRAEGWEFEEESIVPGSVPAGLIALTAGFFWHGVGHFYVGDSRWVGMTLMEAAGLVLIIVGNTLDSDGSLDSSRVPGGIVTNMGVSLFFASWITDVLGAFKGSGSKLADNTFELDGLALEVYFTALLGEGSELTNIGVSRLAVVTGRLVARPEVQFSTDLRYTRFGGGVGYRQPLSSRSDTFLELGGAGFDEFDSGLGAGRTQLSTHLMLSLDIGDLFEHLGGLVLRNSVGVASDWLVFSTDRRRRFRGQNQVLHAIYDASLTANVNRGVNIGFGFRDRRDTLVGAAGPNQGVTYAQLGIVPRNRLGVDLIVERGAFVRAWAGIRYVLVGPSR